MDLWSLRTGARAFYVSGLHNGQIVLAHRTALAKAGLRLFAGDIAADKPPDCLDMLLHESAVGWIRKYFERPISSARQSWAGMSSG